MLCAPRLAASRHAALNAHSKGYEFSKAWGKPAGKPGDTLGKTWDPPWGKPKEQIRNPRGLNLAG